MLNVYLLRHGETTWNAIGQRYCGQTDVPLTPKGIEQANRAAVILHDITFDAVYSSPFQRAHITAKIASGGMHEVITDTRLKETDFGVWEGLSLEEIKEQTPDIWDQWCSNPELTRAGSTGDTAQEVVKRVDNFFQEILSKHSSGNVLIVAHNGVNRFYLAHKLGMPLRNYRKLYQENAAISIFRLDTLGNLDLLKLNA